MLDQRVSVFLRCRPACGDPDHGMGVIIFLPEAEFRLLLQAVQNFVLQNNKDLVCRSLEDELVTVFL